MVATKLGWVPDTSQEKSALGFDDVQIQHINWSAEFTAVGPTPGKDSPGSSSWVPPIAIPLSENLEEEDPLYALALL